jgi:hypothetical protein
MSELMRLGYGTVDFLPEDIPAPIHVGPLHDGIQAIWRFPNNQGASVINHIGSYGTELAVLKFHGLDDHDAQLDYTTPITGDIIGNIDSPDELVELLRRIRDLPVPTSSETGSSDGSGQTISESLGSLGIMIGLADD